MSQNDPLNLDQFRYAGKRKREQDRGDEPRAEAKVAVQKSKEPSQLAEASGADDVQAILDKWLTLVDSSVDQDVQRFQLVVAVILSKQTHQRVLRSTMEDLLARGLTPEAVEAMDVAELRNDIKRIHYNRQKAEQLKQAARLITERGGVPTGHDDVLKLPGIGPTLAKILVKVFALM